MNRSDIVQEIMKLEEKHNDLNNDLKKFGHELKAVSQVSIIARMVVIQQDIAELEKMLDFIEFEEITKDF